MTCSALMMSAKKAVQFHTINTIRQTLSEILLKGYHADHMIDKYIRANPKWSADERKFFVDTVYEILRNKRFLSFLAESEDLLLLVGAQLMMKGYQLPVRPEFARISKEKINLNSQKNKSEAITYSVPDWLDQLGAKDFGSRWPALVKALIDEPKLYIRANLLKTTRDELMQNLKKEGFAINEKIKSVMPAPQALEVKDKKNVFSSLAYRQGHFEVQDVGSQLIAELMQIKPGMTAIDACAGSGGKTLQLASLMQNQGEILAMDVKSNKLQDLKIRADKAGCKIIKTELIKSDRMIKNLSSKADRVLLDAPCSGLGVLKRNPDSKWKMSLEQVDELMRIQRHILLSYSQMCKVGGLVVYATCSLLKRENENQIKWFFEQKNIQQQWQLLSEHRIWPDENSSDAFYAAVLKRI